MKGSNSLKLGIVVSMIVAAFFFGRNSVAPSGHVFALAAEKRGSHSNKLSALPKKSTQLSSKEGRTSLGGAQVDSHARNVADILAKANEQLVSFWNMESIIAEWMANDPEEAIAWLAVGERRDEILLSIFSIWSKADSEAAHAWLVERPNFAGYDAAAIGVAAYLVVDGHHDDAFELADSVTDRGAKIELWADAGAKLHGRDPEGTLEHLDRSGLPDELRRIIIERWNEKLEEQSQATARNMVSVYASAVKFGGAVAGKTTSEVASEIIAGVEVSNDSSTTTFQAPSLSNAELERAVRYLDLNDDGALMYVPVGHD